MYPPSLLPIPRKLLMLDFLHLQIVFLEFLIDWRRRSLLPPKSVPKSLKKLILKHLPKKTMADRFDYILRDKIKRIGDRKLFLIPEDRRRVIFNVIAFCSLGDEDEAVACVNSLIKLFNWTIGQFPHSIQLRTSLDECIIHHLRLFFANINCHLPRIHEERNQNLTTRSCINSVSLPLRFNIVKLRQGSGKGQARDGSQGERPQSLNPCQKLTLKLVANLLSMIISCG